MRLCISIASILFVTTPAVAATDAELLRNSRSVSPATPLKLPTPENCQFKPTVPMIMIYGPKSDGTYIIEFRIADGESLAISVPAGEGYRAALAGRPSGP